MPIIVVYFVSQHSDLPSRLSRAQLSGLMRLDDILREYGARISVEEVSAFAPTNIEAVLQWIVKQKA